MRGLAGVKAQQIIFPQGDLFGEFIHLRADRKVDAIDMVELVRIGMDMDQYLVGMVGGDQCIAIGGGLAQPRADGQYQIGILDPLGQLRIGAIAEIAGIDRTFVREIILPPERDCHRKPDALGILGKIIFGFFAPASAADNRDRIGGIAQHVGERGHRVGAERLGRGDDLGPVECLDGIAQHILGQGKHHRTGSSGTRRIKGPCDIFRNPGSIVDPCRPFGERSKHRGEIDFLKALAVAVIAGNIADKQDHRRRVLHCGMDTDAGIGRPGAACDEGNAGRAGHLAIGLGHEGGAAVLPRRNGLDRAAVVQCVENREKTLAGNGEDTLGALDDQLIDQNLRAGAVLHINIPSTFPRKREYPSFFKYRRIVITRSREDTKNFRLAPTSLRLRGFA